MERMGLAAIEALLFEIEHSDGWVSFSGPDDSSMRGQLRIRARRNSRLAKRLLDMAGESQFAPILSDNAAGTLHVCVQLPKDAEAAFDATGVWLAETMDTEFADDPAMLEAGQGIVSVLNGLAVHRNIEVMVKAGWSEASGGVFYGGVQCHDDPQFLKSVHHLLTYAFRNESGVEDRITLDDSEGMQVIVVRLPEVCTKEIRASIGANITHVYFAHENRCLWFAAGTEKAVEIIRQSVASCVNSSRLARTPLASGRIDMERWLSYPQDDPAGIAQMPDWMDENLWWFPPHPFKELFGIGSMGPQGRPSPVMRQVFDLGGAQQAGFALETDEGGILLTGFLGEALANHIVARIMNAQESIVMNYQHAIEESQRARNTFREDQDRLAEELNK